MEERKKNESFWKITVITAFVLLIIAGILYSDPHVLQITMIEILAGILILLVMGGFIYFSAHIFNDLKKNPFYCRTIKRIVIFIFLADFGIFYLGISFHIQYDADDSNRTASLYWSEDYRTFTESDSTGTAIKEGKAVLWRLGKCDKNIQYRIDFVNDPAETKIRGLRLYFASIPLAYLNGEKLYSYIENICNVSDVRVEGDALCIRPQSSDPQVYFNSDFTSLVSREGKKGYLYLCILADIFIIMIMWIIMKNGVELCVSIKRFWIKNSQKIIWIMKMGICLILLLSAGLVIFLSANSDFNAHPDEAATKSAIDYYLTHWIPPDIRSEEIEDTFSRYGCSRLSEWSIYYFIAGKSGYIFKTLFHCSFYYRIFNVALYILFCTIIMRGIWKEHWLAVLGLSTPQLWYIFSYATSDAWDYFCSFLLIYQIVSKNSLLNKVIGKRRDKIEKRLGILARTGIVSAFIFMGKQNFYVVLLLAFIIFLFRLIVADQEKRKFLFRDYVWILLIFVLVFTMRYAFDFYHYGFERRQINEQVQLLRAEDEYKNSTDLKDRFWGLRLKDRGVSLYGMIKDYHFLEISYKSFCGGYGYMQYFGGDVYYCIMGSFYLLLLILLLINVRKLQDRIERVEYFIVSAIMFLSVFLSICHSWINDFQAQGRYLLPMLISFGYLFSKVKNEFMRNCYYLLIVLTGAAGLSGYYQYGILQLVPL